MTRLLRVHKNRRAFTLVELLVAASVTVIVLTTLCGIYMLIIKEWQRQQGEGEMLVATSRAFEEMSRDLSQAISVDVVTSEQGRTMICYRLPADKQDGIYVPIWWGGSLHYSPGEEKVYYLSDSTGNIRHVGNILWRAKISGWGWGMNVYPDPSWDADRQRGQIAPLDTLDASVDDIYNPHSVTITISSSCRLGDTIKSVTRARVIYLRNAD